MINPFQFHFTSQGELAEGEIFSILYHIYKHGISGTLVVTTENFEKRMVIEGGKIVFASSNLKDDAFGNFLLNQNLIDEEVFKKTSAYMLKCKKRFGRALLELGYFHYEQIWTWVPNHLKSIVYSFFHIKKGHYKVINEPDRSVENIIIDLDLLSLIVYGIRHFKSTHFLKEIFSNIRHLFVGDTKLISHLDLRPYELHVFDLVKRESHLAKILKWSELLEFDTLRLLYLFLVMEIISTSQYSEKPETCPELEKQPRLSAFTSFEEALHYYNMKYELIYKIMLKEIGPIAISLLSKAIEDIMENLPTYFQKIQLNSDGTINETEFLKTIYYYDFDQHNNEFLRGLEEILFTEIYSVKKHLGVDFEQQVLKWISGIGN